MKCILHIGTEKTGSTALQQWLYLNRDALSEQGVFLSDVLQKPNNRDLVAYFQEDLGAFAAIKKIDGEQGRQAFFEGFAESLVSEIRDAAASHHTMIITSEHFHSRTTRPGEIRRVRDFLLPLFDDIAVLVYLREQSAVRKSLYSTSLKFDGVDTLANYQRHVTASNHYYNYALFLGKWEQAFGRERLSVRLYDPTAFTGGDLRKDFILAAVPGIDLDHLAFPQEPANASLTFLQAAAYRAVNRAVPYFRPGGGVDKLNIKFKRLLLKIPALQQGDIVDPRAAEFAAMFTESNEALYQRYFGGRRVFGRTPRADDVAPDAKHPLAAVAARVEDAVDRFAREWAQREITPENIEALREALLAYQWPQPEPALRGFLRRLFGRLASSRDNG